MSAKAITLCIIRCYWIGSPVTAKHWIVANGRSRRFTFQVTADTLTPVTVAEIPVARRTACQCAAHPCCEHVMGMRREQIAARANLPHADHPNRISSGAQLCRTGASSRKLSGLIRPTFIVPRMRARPMTEDTTIVNHQEPPGKLDGLRVLVVEDIAILAWQVRDVLATPGQMWRAPCRT